MIDDEAFPTHVARMIQNCPRVQPQEFESVSNLTAGICHFWRVYVGLSGEEIFSTMNALHSTLLSYQMGSVTWLVLARKRPIPKTTPRVCAGWPRH